MPAVRPYWKGYIKLALVSCPIGLWKASSSGEHVAFRQINKKTGNRLRRQLVDDETREPVEASDKGRGYEYAKGSYLMIEDHELDAIEIESNRTIEIDTFVPRAEIDERFLDSPNYIAPNEPVGQEAFAVIREAMRSKDMVALGWRRAVEARARDHAAALGWRAARHDATVPVGVARGERLFLRHSRHEGRTGAAGARPAHSENEGSESSTRQGSWIDTSRPSSRCCNTSRPGCRRR